MSGRGGAFAVATIDMARVGGTQALQGGLGTSFVVRTNSVGGFSRIARDAHWADSVTGGEACGYLCSEKEGFTHPWFWRAPYFWGAKNLETARWVNLRARVLKALS